jgi:hypothetical protein
MPHRVNMSTPDLVYLALSIACVVVCVVAQFSLLRRNHG